MKSPVAFGCLFTKRQVDASLNHIFLSYSREFHIILSLHTRLRSLDEHDSTNLNRIVSFFISWATLFFIWFFFFFFLNRILRHCFEIIIIIQQWTSIPSAFLVNTMPVWVVICCRVMCVRNYDTGAFICGATQNIELYNESLSASLKQKVICCCALCTAWTITTVYARLIVLYLSYFVAPCWRNLYVIATLAYCTINMVQISFLLARADFQWMARRYRLVPTG